MFKRLGSCIFLLMAFISTSNASEHTGTYEIIEIDYPNGTSKTVEYLLDRNGARRALKAVNQDILRRFKSGDKIRVKTSASTSEMVVESAELTTYDEAGVAYLASDIIEKKILSVLVDFSDYPSHATSTSLVPIQDSAKTMYNETTFGKIQLNFDANGNGTRDVYRVKIADATTVGCSSDISSSWRTKVLENLASRGISTSIYTNMVLYLPKEVTCTWYGLGHVGSLRPTSSWLLTAWIKNESSTSPRTTIHELGHNTGLRHAGKDNDNNSIAETEYGDTSCFMGSALRSTNGPHSIALGAYEDHHHSIEELTDKEKFFTISASDIHPDSTPHPHVVKVLRNIVSSSKKNYYYLSYRRGVGTYDVNLASIYKTGVSIHTQNAPGAPTLYVRTLIPGEIFNDVENGVSISMGEKSSDGSNIDVLVSQINNIACKKAAPKLALNESYLEFNTHSSGTTNVLVTNNNSNGCPASIFNIGLASSSPNLTASASSPAVTLASGESASVAVELQSNAYHGPYKVNLTSQESGNIGAIAELNISVLPVNPEAPTSLSYTLSSTEINLSWNASTSPSIVKYEVYRKYYGDSEFLKAGTTDGLQFTETLPAQQATYYVIAIDEAGLVSPQSAEKTYTPDTNISAPTGLTRTVISPNVTLNWSAATSSVAISRYDIYRRNYDITTYALVGQVNGSILSYTEKLPTVKVYYKVMAVNVYGKVSEFSNEVSYAPATSLTAPSNLSLTIAKPNLNLKWVAASSSVGVSYYRIYRKLSSESLYKSRGTVTTLSFTETLPTQSATYYVKAYDVYGYTKSSVKITYRK